MPATYTLIASNTLSSSAASVTFSSIPGTYTDLVLKYTARADIVSYLANITIKFNSSSTTDYSYTSLIGDGATTISSTRNSSSSFLLQAITAASATTNNFASNEIYIPNYAGSNNKCLSLIEAAENDSTTASRSQIAIRAGLRSNTDAITSITLDATNFISGSSFFLYGIKNS